MAFVSRSAWGAAFGNGQPLPQRSVSLVVIHHTAGAVFDAGASEDAERAEVRRIESQHSEPKPAGNGWDGIGYNFLVFPSGRVYEGRGWARVGAHTEGHNSKSVGMAYVGNTEAAQPTPPAMLAIRELIAVGLMAKHIVEPFEIKGHRDFAATQCPGALLYARLAELRPPPAALDPVTVRREAIEEIRRQLFRIEATL